MTENVKVVCIISATILFVVLSMSRDMYKSRQVMLKMYCHEHQKVYDRDLEDCAVSKWLSFS